MHIKCCKTTYDNRVALDKYVIEYKGGEWGDLHFPQYIVNLQMHLVSRQYQAMFKGESGCCTANVKSANSADSWRLKVASHRSLSCLVTLKPHSLSTEVLHE